MKSLTLALFCIGFAAVISTAASYEVFMTDLRPDGMTLNWDLSGRPGGVMGFEVSVECDAEEFTVTEAQSAAESVVPTDWMVQCSVNTAKCLGFSLQGSKATESGPILEYQWLPTLGKIDVSSFAAANHLSEQIALDIQRPTEIPQPTLDVYFSIVKPYYITLATKMDGWHEVAKGSFAVYVTDANGEIMHDEVVLDDKLNSGVSSLDCDYQGGDGVLYCDFVKIPHHDANFARFTFGQGGYDFHVVKGHSVDTVQDSFESTRRHTLTFDVHLENGGQIKVPKVGLGFSSVTAVPLWTTANPGQTCGTTGEFCVKKEMEVVVSYRNFDSQVTFAGFQFEIQSGVTWKRARLEEDLTAMGFQLSDNNRGTYVCFSMTAGAAFPHAEDPRPILHAFYEREAREEMLVIANQVVSNSVGAALGTIIYAPPGHGEVDIYADEKTALGGNLYVPNCDGVDPPGSDKDGLCDDEDEDCDCCLNNVDSVPREADKGCGMCGDVDNDGKVGIMDAILDINMLVGIQEHDAQNGDANGDGLVTVLDVVRIVHHILTPTAEVKTRPCDMVIADGDDSE